MQLEQAIYDALTASPGTAAGPNVTPGVAPQGTSALPRITFARVGNSPSLTLGGNAGVDFVRIQVDCWAASFVAAKALAEEVRDILEAQPFKALLQSDFSAYEADTKLHRWSADYRCIDKL